MTRPSPSTKPSAADAFAALGRAVNNVTAAAMLARAVAEHVPDDEGSGGKADCLDAIELQMLRPAAAELQAAYGAFELARHRERQ